MAAGHPVSELADLLPHRRLVGLAPQSPLQVAAHARALTGPVAGVIEVVGLREDGRVVVPAASLHAGHRDLHLRAGRHQHREVDDAVLLGADQLLAVYQQYGFCPVVQGHQLLDAARLGLLGYAEAAIGQCLAQREVGRLSCLLCLRVGARRAAQRKYRQVAENRCRPRLKTRQPIPGQLYAARAGRAFCAISESNRVAHIRCLHSPL